MHSAAEQAVTDFRIKLVLERNFRVRLNRFNQKMIRAMMTSVAVNGDISNFDKFTPEIERILNAHYHFVGRVFIDRINRMVLDVEEKALTPVLSNASGMMIETMAARSKPKVPVVVSRHYNALASSASGKITATTKKHARDALNEARNMHITSSFTGIEAVDLASLSGSIFNIKLDGRTTGIVRLNTNAPAEAAKLTQIQLLRGEEPSFSGGSASKGTKAWANQGDSRVRDGVDSKFNHLFAEQIVKLHEPFTVNGEKLRYPGDKSLGASIGNLINCRCSATYDIADTVKVREAKVTARESVPKIVRKPKRKVVPKPKPKSTLPKASESVNFQESTVGKPNKDVDKQLRKFKIADNSIQEEILKRTDPANIRAANDLIDDVTDAVENYVDSSDNINTFLRKNVFTEGPFAGSKQDLKKTIKFLDEAIEFSKTQETITVFRGMTPRSAIRLNPKIGTEFTDKAFGSWSGQRKIATEFMGLAEDKVASEGSIMLRMKVKKGTKSLFIDRSESEFLFPRNMKYRVLDVEKNVPISKIGQSGEARDIMRRTVVTVEAL